MYVLVGTRSKVKKDFWAGRTKCPRCGQVCNFHLTKVIVRILVFFIPIISITNKRYLVCDSCEWAKELSRKEYKEIRKKQMRLLDSGGIPDDIIKTDFNPPNIKFGWRIIKLIASGMWEIFTLLWVIAMTIDVLAEGEIVLSVLLGLIFLGGLYSIPFVICVKHLIPELKMRRIYNSLISGQERILK